jgi:hypothetical protein
MSTYKKPARIKDCSVQFVVPDGEALWPKDKVLLLVKELERLIEQDEKRRTQDRYLSDFASTIEEFVADVQDIVDYDPTGEINGEPPLSAIEMANISFQQKLALKK